MITTNKLRDPNLSEEEQDAIIGAFVRQRENEALRKRWVVKLDADHGVKKPGSKRATAGVIRKITFAVLAIAASLLVVFMLLPGLNGAPGEELLAEYLEEVTIQTSRSGAADNTLDSLRNVFRTDFLREDYAAAITVGQQISTAAAVTETDQYNLGLAYLKGGDNDRAITILRELLTQPTDLETEARFHLALALLEDNQTSAGLEVLREIEAADGLTIFNKAQELLEGDWEQ